MNRTIKEERGRIPGRMVVSVSDGKTCSWQRECEIADLEHYRDLAAKHMVKLASAGAQAQPENIADCLFVPPRPKEDSTAPRTMTLLKQRPGPESSEHPVDRPRG